MSVSSVAGAVGAPARAPRVTPAVRWAIGVLGLALVALGCLAVSRLASDPERFPVEQVDVLGTLDYTDREALRERIDAELRRGFYGLDIDVVRHAVESLPWVASARVGRVWPARLSIEIEEHEPAARWNEDALLGTRAELFRPPQLAADDVRHAEWLALFRPLPRLAGADGRHAALFEALHRYGRELERFGVRIVALEEDARRSQTLELSNHVTVRLGYEEHALRLARFIDVYERLVTPLAGRAARFDMRYSNGFALSGPSALSGTSAPPGTSALAGTSVPPNAGPTEAATRALTRSTTDPTTGEPG